MTYRAAVIQAASVPFAPMETAEKGAALMREAAQGGATLIVFPEVFLGGYPKGASFATVVGQRKPEGREAFRRYHQGAVAMDGPELALLVETARERGVHAVVGCLERDGGTLYCTAVFIDPDRGITGKHRKLMPTASERLIWGFGDGSTLPVMDMPMGRAGAVICWENYMPALRLAMFAKGVSIYCAPTADDRDGWAASMRHIALEGRCYVLSACQHITRGAYGLDYACELGDDPDLVLMRGGSMIVDPLGNVLAGPDYAGETILYASIDPGEVVRGKYDFDVVGHYARPDIFRLHVDQAPKPPVVWED